MKLYDRILIRAGLRECAACRAEADRQNQLDLAWAAAQLEESERRLAQAKALEAQLRDVRKNLLDQLIERRDAEYRFVGADELDASGLDDCGWQ